MRRAGVAKLVDAQDLKSKMAISYLIYGYNNTRPGVGARADRLQPKRCSHRLNTAYAASLKVTSSYSTNGCFTLRPSSFEALI